MRLLSGSFVLLWACLVIAAGVIAVASREQDGDPVPGIAHDLAESRAARVAHLRYELTLLVPALADVPVRGTNVVRFTLTDASAPLVFDFAPGPSPQASVTSGGRAVDARLVNGHIVVPPAALRQGENELTITFVAGDAALNRTRDFLYALFVPARAHLSIPVFDQPDLKARWTLKLGVPAATLGGDGGWQMIANGLPEQAPVDDATGSPADCRGAEGSAVDPSSPGTCYEVHRFAETEPLPSYLFSFALGHFQVESAIRDGLRMQMFHRETDAAKVARNKDAIFDLHARALTFMEDYTGIRYPFGKFDFVLIPAFQFGGMEHAGAIVYNAPGLLLDESATQNQLLGRASVIAHETAHMWFGDLVTMRWFDDVWMKEVFANFMAAKIVNPSFPEVNHELRFLLSHYPSAYEIDRTAGANPIRQRLDNLNEAGSLYGNIIYDKAPIVMRHLESLMGEVEFRNGLREYLRTYAFRNATWRDLVALLDQRTSSDLASWSRVWVEEPGRPTIATRVSVVDGRVARLAFEQRDAQGRGRAWTQELRVTLGYPEGARTLSVLLDGSQVDVREAVGLAAPLYVLPQGAGWAYGEFEVDRTTRDYLLASLPEIRDPVTRGAAWITLWDAMLAHAVPPDTLVDLALTALPRETDEQLTARVLGYFEGAWWRFLTPAARASRIDRVETTLRAGLDRARSASQKAAWFSTLRDTAATAPTQAWLRRVWSREETIPGLPLAETDEINLALELAVRDTAGWRELLQAQLDRTENPDRKARLAFVRPALSADPAERDAWFTSLRRVENRRREPWVLEGLTYLHHPLRAAASARYVPPALAMLREIQQTGDIFFPKRWLDATLHGHNSPEVVTEVRRFLDGLPADYPPRLRQITLQSADELFRTQTGPGPR